MPEPKRVMIHQLDDAILSIEGEQDMGGGACRIAAAKAHGAKQSMD